VGPFILRRLKSDPAIVADLPEKLENTVSVTLSVEQAALYEAAVQESFNTMFTTMETPIRNASMK
jgi:SNF2 family DNA or RNA helicase